MKTISYLTILFLTTVLFYSCGSDKPEKTAIDTSAIKVTLDSVVNTDISTFLSVSGRVEAVNSANLSTRIMGTVNKVNVKIGDKVRKGQLLLSINSADMSAQLAQVNAKITEAEAAFENAKKDYERYTSLFSEESASQKELDDITAHYNMAKARLTAAKQMKNEVNAQFSYANIKAPFNGVVVNKFVKAGDIANPGMPLLEIESPGEFQVVAMVPESEIATIKAKTNVKVVLKSLDTTITGKVSEVSTSAKNTGGQYLVKVALDKTDANLFSGMFVTVQFPENNNNNALVLLPESAIIKQGQLTGIYTVSSQNTAILRWIQLGRNYGEKVQVLSGLEFNEPFILSAEGKLYNGVKISY
ncbi:MAG: efflux transporter periplasmic adaptor subunit [Flavobacteriales bacterium]|nr:MAG: efflux transporter periplasmic adaptor subunit [Flavobacteriales bacterium]